MKKLAASLLIASMTLSLVACGSSNKHLQERQQVRTQQEQKQQTALQQMRVQQLPRLTQIQGY